jgi:hypothetical protein
MEISGAQQIDQSKVLPHKQRSTADFPGFAVAFRAGVF